MKTTTNWFVPVLLIIGSLAASFVVLEVAFRVDAALADESLEDLHRLQAPVPGHREATLGEIIRLSRHPQIIYELRPNMSVLFRGVQISTNAAGFRDRTYDQQATPNTVRIIGLGDSIMFGWGVPDGVDFLSLLERRLNEEFPERTWEVINMAVPGYNAAMELATLKERGMAYQPDIVIMDFLANDIALPNFVHAGDFLSVNRSFLLDFVSERFARLPPPRGLRAQTRLDDRAERDPKRVPAAFRHMVGWAAYDRVMSELGELRRRHGFDVLISCVFGLMSERARTSVATQGFPIACTWEDQQRFLASQGLETRFRARKGSPLTVSETDAHPSILGHAIAAQVVYTALQNEGFIHKHLASQAGKAVALSSN